MIRSIQQRAMMPGEKYPKGYIQTHQTKNAKIFFLFLFSMCKKYLFERSRTSFFLLDAVTESEKNHVKMCDNNAHRQ